VNGIGTTMTQALRRWTAGSLGCLFLASRALAEDIVVEEAVSPPPAVEYVDPALPFEPDGGEHYHYHPRLSELPPEERNAESLIVGVPRHAKRGLTATLSVRYRKVSGSTIVRMQMSPGLNLEQATPPATRGPENELLWFGLQGPMGNLKVKARIHPDVPAGTALLVHVDLIDSSGRVEQTTETIVVR
jgi:hypothetical protein